MRVTFLKKLCQRKSAHGQVVLECLAGILMFTIMLALILSITMWLYVQQALVTSAREGARQASLNGLLASSSTRATGVATVKSSIKEQVSRLTGLTISDPGITVTGPTGSVLGKRIIKVDLTLGMKNPVNVAGFMKALGAANTAAFDTLPVNATATLRYEE